MRLILSTINQFVEEGGYRDRKARRRRGGGGWGGDAHARVAAHLDFGMHHRQTVLFAIENQFVS